MDQVTEGDSVVTPGPRDAAPANVTRDVVRTNLVSEPTSGGESDTGTQATSEGAGDFTTVNFGRPPPIKIEYQGSGGDRRRL